MKYLKFFLPAIITLGILFVLFSRLEWREVYEVSKGAEKGFLLAALLVILIAHFLTALRWKEMLKIVDCRIDLRTALRLFFANLPVAKIVPLYGGEFLRTYYLKDKVSMTRHGGVIFAGMVLDVLTLAAISFVGGIILGMKNIYIFSLLAAVGLIVSLGLAEILRRRVPFKFKSKLDNFFVVFYAAMRNPAVLIKALSFTLAIWFFVLLFIQFVFFALSASVSFSAILAIHPVVTLVSLLPITVWGIGTRETVMILLYAGFAEEPIIFAVGLTYSFVGAVLMPVLFLPLSYKTWRKIAHKSSFFKK